MSLLSFLGIECGKESADASPSLYWEPATAPDPQCKRWDTKPRPRPVRQLQSQATDGEGNAAGQTDLLPDHPVSMATRASMSIKSSMTLRMRDLWGRGQAVVVTGKLSDGNRMY